MTEALQKKLARSPIARAIFNELSDSEIGYTVKDLHNLLGGDRRHLNRRITELRELGGIFIASWQRQDDSPGDFAPVYRVKTARGQKDARRPAAYTSAEIARRKREKYRVAYRAKYVALRGLKPNPFGMLADFFHRPSNVRKAVEADVVRMYKQGMMVTHIARELSCSQSTVSRVLQEKGLRKPQTRVRSEDVRDQVYAMADAGVSQMNIAREFGIHRMTVYLILRRRREIMANEQNRRAA